MSEHPVFDALHNPLLNALLSKSNLTQSEQEALQVLNVYSEGMSGSEVLQIHSQLASVPQIRGHSILKLTAETQWNKMHTEEERYQQLGSLKQLFADLRWSTRISDPSNAKQYFCSFWQSAQNQSPLAEMQNVSTLKQQDQILRALRLTSTAIINHIHLDDIESKQSFVNLCQLVLGYRCDPIKGKIYSFVHEILNLSIKYPTFYWNELTLPNPLYYTRHANTLNLLETYYGDVHGDLHPGNIFVSSHPDINQVCLIDSGLSEHRFPLFYDQAYLELSVLMRADLSQRENTQQWMQLLEALNDETHLSSHETSGLKSIIPEYTPFYEQIRAIRLTLTDLLQKNRGQSQEIRQQYHLMRICAALNFCNKPLRTVEQKKFAYLYASFQLKAFIERYGDDDTIAELKLSLRDNPDQLYQSEQREQNQIERFWRKWSMQNWPQPIVVQELLDDFENLPFPSHWFPSPLIATFASRFLGLVWPNAYEESQSSEEKIAVLGILAKALQYQFYPLSVALNKPYAPFLEVMENKQQYWNKSDVINALHFVNSVIEDALFQAETLLFERGSLLMISLISRLEPSEQTYWQHCLTHFRAKWLSMHLNIPNLIELLEVWLPEQDEELIPEFLIKKAMLLATCYHRQLDSALQVLSEGLTQLDLWPFQVQSQFLEAYLILRSAFRIQYNAPTEDIISKKLKNKGFNGILEWFKDWEQEYQTPSRQSRDGQYSIVWHAQDPTVSEALHAIEGTFLLMRSGHLPVIWNQILISVKTWETINDRLFQDFPQLCFYYSLQYLLTNPVDAEWVRVQLQKHLLNQHSKYYSDLKQSFYQQLCNVFTLLQGRDSRFYMLILAVLSEFIPVLPYRDWKDVFATVWEEFHKLENNKVLYSQTQQGPYLLSRKALARIEDLDLLISCLNTLMKTDGEFDADYYIRPELLNQIIHNSNFELLTLTPALEQSISANIEALQDTTKRGYALIKLNLLQDKLKPEHQISIAEQILQLPRLPGFTSRIFPILIHFTRKHVQARQHLHELILAEKERTWETGVKQNPYGSWRQSSFGSFVFPLHMFKRTATYPEGLIFSEKEVWEIYQALKSSLEAFNASPFAKPQKRLFGAGLDFTLLKEMYYFLEDYRTILVQDSDYSEIKENIMAGIHEHAPSSGRPADLIATTPNTVREGIDRLVNLLREANFDALSEYWNNLLSKILLQAKPHLVTCLKMMSYWLVYYREEAYFQKPFFIQMYLQILERYQQFYPSENQDYANIESYLVDLAMVLDFWGLSSPAIEHFLSLRQTSVYEDVRKQTELAQRDTFHPSLIVDTQNDFKLLQSNHWYLHALQVQGFKSFSSTSATNVTFNSINLLIGANGSGKSSLLSLFSFVQTLAKMSLNSVGTVLGQASDFLFYGPKNTPAFSILLVFKSQNLQLEYSFTCEINKTRSHLFLIDEKISWQTDSIEPKLLEHLEAHTESLLLSRKQEPAVQALNSCLEKIHAFHFQDTSFDAPLRQAAKLQDDQQLEPNARNLAAILYRMRSQPSNEKYYRLLRSVIQQVFRQFDDFILEPNLEKQMIALKWSEVGANDYNFSAHQVSDGTLRFMAMVTLLLQPPEYLPHIIILDEPELGLHPTGLSLLAALLEQASQHCQLIIATQSGDLLNHFSIKDIIVIDRTQVVEDQYLTQYATRLSRKNESELAVWLKDYTLHELWDKNVLGGKP